MRADCRHVQNVAKWFESISGKKLAGPEELA